MNIVKFFKNWVGISVRVVWVRVTVTVRVLNEMATMKRRSRDNLTWPTITLSYLPNMDYFAGFVMVPKLHPYAR